MRVPFVNFKRQYETYKEGLDNVWHNVMSNGDFIMRSQLRDFENKIADIVGVKYAIGVNTGTDALYLSAHALGWKKGDEVITVGHTFVATIGAIVQCGAKPILVDVGKDYNIDVTQIKKAITKQTKGIIPVHLNGHPCDMAMLMQLADKHNLKVIEDAAQALGSRYNDQSVGSFGDIGIFSFYPSKMIGTCGDGGIIVTNNDKLAKKLYALRDNGRYDDVKRIECYGFCSRLDNLHAAILLYKLRFFDDWIDRRREIAKQYYIGLSNIKGLTLMDPPGLGRYHDVYQNYVIRVKNKTIRDKLAKHLKENQIDYLISWVVPNHKQKALKLNQFKLPETENISDTVLSIPMYPELHDQEVDYVIKTIKEFFSR